MGHSSPNFKCLLEVLEYHVLCRDVLATFLQERGLCCWSMQAGCLNDFCLGQGASQRRGHEHKWSLQNHLVDLQAQAYVFFALGT